MKLKFITLKDAAEIYTLTELNRTYLREWLPWLDGINTVEDTESFIRDCLATNEIGKTATYTIWHQGKIAGLCGYNLIDHDKKVGFIGYWLGAEFQGNGLMTDACRELEKIGFESLGLNTLIIRAAEENYKSRAIPERLGYEVVDRVDNAEWLYDHYVDFVVYQKTRM